MEENKKEILKKVQELADKHSELKNLTKKMLDDFDVIPLTEDGIKKRIELKNVIKKIMYNITKIESQYDILFNKLKEK